MDRRPVKPRFIRKGLPQMEAIFDAAEPGVENLFDPA